MDQYSIKSYDVYEIIKTLNKFSNDQIEKLSKLKYASGNQLITSNLNESGYIYEYIYLFDIDIYDFDQLYIESEKILIYVSNFKDFIKNLSIFNSAKKQLQIEIENIRNKVEVVDGAYICSNCSSSKTVSSSALRASADEATTIFIVCVACGHKWHIKG